MASADCIIRQGDTTPALATTILGSNGSALNLTSATVSFTMRTLTSNTPVTLAGTASITNATAGQVQFAWAAADTQTPGLYMGEWHVTLSGGGTYTFPNDGYLSINIEQNLTTPGGQLLVSLADAKDYLNIPTTDHTRDAKLVRFIRSLTPQIEAICGPILINLHEEWHTGGQYFIKVRRRPSTTYETTPVLTLFGVSEYRGPVEYTLSDIPDPAHGSIYSYMMDMFGIITRRTSGGGIIAFPAMPQAVHVWYASGQSAVPSNVYEGTLELLRLHFRSSQQGHPRPGGGGGGATVDEEEPGHEMFSVFVPPKIREYLAPQRRAPSIA